MGFGRYRFRRSFGNVKSQFRGARFDTYPLIQYPTENRVLDLSSFTYTSVEAPDISGEDNDAILYSGRAGSLNGLDAYFEIPDVGATKSITFLAKSSTDTTIYATDDATQTEDATTTITANDTWQEVTITFTNAISGAIRLGSDGANFFSGELAWPRCYDAGSSLLAEGYANEHTNVGGTDGLPLVMSDGSTGQYVNTAAVIQEGIDQAVAPLVGAGLDDAQWFNGVDTSLDYGSPLLPATGNFDETFTIYIGNTSAPSSFLYYFFQKKESVTGATGFAIASSTGYLTFIANAVISIQDTSRTYYGETVEVRITRTSGVFELFLNGVSVGTDASKVDFSIPQGGTSVWGDSPPNVGNRHAVGLIYGDNVTGTPSGNFATVADKLRTPPQVLGMDFNQYVLLDGSDGFDANANYLPATGDFTLTVDFFVQGAVAANESIFSQGASGQAGCLLSSYKVDGAINCFIDGAGTLTTTNTVNHNEMNRSVLTRSGGQFTLTLNGGTTVTLSDGSTSIDQSSFVRVGHGYGGSDLVGAVTCFIVDGVVSWKGSSKDATALGWTLPSSYSDWLVASYGGSTDAYGNAIVNPRGSKTHNADGSGFALVPDADSLDVTTEATWVIRGNFYGVLNSTQDYVSKYDTDLSWSIYKSVSSPAGELRIAFGDPSTGLFFNQVKFTGITDKVSTYVIRFNSGVVSGFEDSVELSMAGAAPTSLRVNDTPIKIGARAATTNLADAQIDLVKNYDSALTDEEIQNANWS